MEDIAHNKTVKYWGVHKLTLLLIIAIVTALTLTIISMYLYISSGAIQLDLSRPGYRGVSSQNDTSYQSMENFSESGVIDEQSVGEFEAIFFEQSSKAQSIEAYSGDPLSPTNLNLVVTLD